MTTAAAANKQSMVVDGGNVMRIVYIQKSVPWSSILTHAFPTAGASRSGKQSTWRPIFVLNHQRSATSAGHILSVYKGVAFPSLLRNFTGLSHQQVPHSSKTLKPFSSILYSPTGIIYHLNHQNFYIPQNVKSIDCHTTLGA